MATGMRTTSFKPQRSLPVWLGAFLIGMAPLAASTAAAPSEGNLSVEAAVASAEIVPLTGARLPETAEAESDQPAINNLGGGTASYYASKFNGRRTASGETFDNAAMTAAHRSLPFGSLVRVTNMATGESVTVRINDRGPFTRGRVIDVSRAAAEDLGIVARGHAKVELELIDN